MQCNDHDTEYRDGAPCKVSCSCIYLEKTSLESTHCTKTKEEEFSGLEEIDKSTMFSCNSK